MEKFEEGLPKRSQEWMTIVAKTQQQSILEAREVLENVLHMGIASVDVEYMEELICDIESLIDYYTPSLLKSFRYLFTVLHYAEYHKQYSEAVSHINFLLVVLEQAEKYLKLRAKGAGPDVNSVIESQLGYLWRNIDLLEYKLYEDDAEILQLSFNSVCIDEGRTIIDKAYWFSLKSGKIHYSRRIRPDKALRFIKAGNTEFDVLQPERLFIYPGEMSNRIRWKTAGRRKITSDDIAVLLKTAQTDYTEAVNVIKESFRNPLAERTPIMFIKLHKAYINGDHLVLEDKQGGLLTVADLPDDKAPTSELLRGILPAQSDEWALLVEVNDDLQADLFAVKPLSIVTPDRIIRLLY